MATENQRPRFYEGQYLAAADLDTIVDYLRAADARHALGGHTWGVAAGLHLTEKPTPGAPDRVEVTLQPGFAWDGFGRLIVNTRPLRLREDLFAGIAYTAGLDDVANGKTGRLVPVWLQYDETRAANPPPGFETCATDDQYARVGELFRFEIGERTEAEQRASIKVGTATVDALKALQAYYKDPSGSVPPQQIAANLWDTSVPHQQLPPADRPPLWLMPIGYVRWVARDQALGYFARRDLNPADNAVDRIRAFRRYIGVVAESIEAADAAIVLHRRGDRPDGPHRFTNLLRSGKAETLLQDLVWVEGNLRVVGDEKIAGGELRFTDANGGEQGTPLYIGRAGDDPSPAADGNRELHVFVGPAAQSSNRVVIGSEQAGPPVAPAPTLVVVSSGRVGVGTRDPATSLEVVGDWNNGEGAIRVTGDQPAIHFEPGAAAGNQVWAEHVTGTSTPKGNLRFACKDNVGTWKDVLHLTPSRKVGVVTAAPRNPLGIRAAGPAEDLLSFEDTAGTTKWHISRKLADGSASGFSLVETQDPNGEGRFFIKDGGNVGFGTVAPAGAVSIKSKDPAQGTLNFFTPGSADVEYDGGTDKLFVFKDSQNGRTSFMQTQVGVGTVTPRCAFAVRGIGAGNEAVSFENGAGVTKWHVNLNVAGSNGGFNFAETNVADARLFLENGGRVGIGTRTPQEALHVNGKFVRVDGVGDEQAYMGGDGIAGDVQVGSLNPAIMTVSLYNPPNNQSMDLDCRVLTCTGFNPFSDARMKENVAPIDKALRIVTKLRGVKFRWKEEVFGERRDDFGVIAQEVKKVVPALVHETRKGLSVAYLSLIPILIESVKELKDEVDALRDQVKQLSRADKAAPRKRRKDGE